MSESNKEKGMTEKPVKDKWKLEREAYKDFIDEFKEESDRAAVILGAAKLDLYLYQILIKVLLPNPSGQDDLFDGDGPLSTFSAKIHLSYRMGLIDAGLAHSLHMIRKIRNAFAHEVTGCKLDSGSHRDRVKELMAPLISYDKFEKGREAFFKDETSCSAYFRTTLAIIALGLEVLLKRAEPLDLKTHPLIPPRWRPSESEKSSKKDDKS